MQRTKQMCGATATKLVMCVSRKSKQTVEPQLLVKCYSVEVKDIGNKCKTEHTKQNNTISKILYYYRYTVPIGIGMSNHHTTPLLKNKNKNLTTSNQYVN